MTESPYIVHLDEQNFMQVVVEGSDQTPILIDFWADWCGPCKTLMPILEKLAIEFNGAFILAKLDTEAYPNIAQQFGIRSLPTVMLLKDRQPVDQFMGALPESEVRQFLQKHVGEPLGGAEDDGQPNDARVMAAMQLFEQGQTDAARQMLQQAQAEEPENVDILLALGQVSVNTGDLETAESCLKALPEEERQGLRGLRLEGLIDLTRASHADHSVDALQASLEQNPKDSQVRYDLAVTLAMTGQVQPAMDHFLRLIQTDAGFNDGAPRARLLSLFNVLGNDPLVSQYRRKLFALLH